MNSNFTLPPFLYAKQGMLSTHQPPQPHMPEPGPPVKARLILCRPGSHSILGTETLVDFQ